MGTTGLLQIYYGRRWVHLCSLPFHTKEAKVACRELGLPIKHVKRQWTNPQSTDMFPFYPICNGEERFLVECNHRETYGTCEPVQLSCNAVCPPRKFGDNCNRYCPCDTESTASCDMNTGECVCKPGFTGHTCNCAVGSHSCNTTISDCYYESNQILCICKAGFTSLEHGCVDNVRISTTNTVEIFEQEWQKICSYTNWNVNNSLVVCRQQNLSTDVIYTGSEYISLSAYYDKSISCNGTERTWSECETTQLTSDCRYARKLMCGKCPEWKYSSDCSKYCQCDKKTSVGCDPNTGVCLCHEKYGGTDCSCHTSTISTCKSPYSTCEYDRCKCKQGSFNVSTSCSDWNDVVFFCSFSGYNWQDLCDMETSNSRLRHTHGSKYPSWKPEYGSDDAEFVFLGDAPSYSLSISYFAALNFSIKSKRSRLCVIFDYVISRRGSIVVSMKDTLMKESIIVSLEGKKKSWTNKRININSSLPIYQIIFVLEVRAAIDQIIITESMCDCANWTFGSNCDDCACVRVHTKFCDKNNGYCHCKQGYTGDACQCEDNGEPCPHYIRLVNGNTTSMGRIEVVTNGVWSTVCDEDWDHDDATVVCKQLGLGKYGIAVSNAEFGKGNGPNYIGKIDCQGNETDIMTCSFKKLTCSHDSDAGVICANLSDSIRLVNGSNKTNGRLEVRINGRGTWGTVCGLGDRIGAKVACKELGLPTRHVEVADYGEGSRPILYVYGCTGNENSIQLCPKTIRYPTFCSHLHDLGLSCSNDCPSFTFGAQCENRCICDKSKSLSCDKDTGDCVCKIGWTGKRCTCGVGTECGENSYCYDDDCLCLDGFLTKPSNCSDKVLVLYSCSFETDFETCSIENGGSMKWRRNSGGTPSNKTGPYSAKDAIYYVYTESNGQSVGDSGVMSLSNLNLTTDACFQFYYHMRGKDMGKLKVIVRNKSGSKIDRWSKSGHINSSWNRGRISLPANSQKITVIGERDYGYSSDIALDDFKILQGHCGCEPWKYGLRCENSCDCRRVSSKSCNSKNGSCVCQPGWSGKTCNCWMSHDNCHSTYSYCHGDRCLCKDGIYSNGVTCSGLNDVTYFCGFDTRDSLKQCTIELLRPMQWEIIEELEHPLDDGYHSENNRYLKTLISPYTRNSFFLFLVKNVRVDVESCLHVKYFINYEEEQMIRILVVKDNNLLNNRLFQGKGWSTARVPLKTSSNMKIYFIGYLFRNSPVMIDDIIITSKHCVGCTPWFYGGNCEKLAKCNRSNTFSFDDKGVCHCREHWFGDRCDCSKEENDACFKNGEVCRNGQCTCKDGYIRAGTGCRDIDECKFLCDSQTQECTNTNGSYTCVCKNGTGDGIICSESSLAVINGTSPQEGTLLMWKQGAWGAFCMDFDLFTGITACNTMFKDIYGVYITKRGSYRSTNGVAYTSPKCNRRGTFDFENCDVSLKPCDTEKDALYLKCGVCGGKYTSEFGLVEPPPQLPANTLCSFLLSPTNAKTINATFITFSIGSTDEIRSIGCKDTNVEIFDGSNKDAPFLGRFCHNKGNFTINSSGNSLYFVYQTSRDTTKQDFQLIYEIETAERNLSALGKQCADDIQCKANNASCVDNVCKCEIDFYQWDEASCAKKKSWNSSCNGNNECETKFCNDLDKLCLCPPNTSIDGNYSICLNITDIIEIQTSSPKYWMVPFLLFLFLIIVLVIAITVVFARRKGYCLKRRDQKTAYTYSELMSASSSLCGMSTNDRSLQQGSGISINESAQNEDTGLIEMSQS